MASLFAGSPQQAPSYAATTSDVPKWLQDYTVDLFSQQRAVSATPYQPYALPRIAGTTDATTQAQNLITRSSGAYQPAMGNAIAGTQGLTSQQAGTTAGLGYLQQAAGMSGSAAAAPLFGQATNMATQAGGINTAAPLNMMQGQYTNPNLATQNLNLGQNALAQSGQTATSNIGAYMNPFTQNVTDQIATLGARNLSENLLPAVSDQFIRAGQFGSSGMGTFGGRALRDTQEAILNQQNQALQAGYGQALTASQADLARQAQLGQTYTQAGQAQQATGIGAAQAVAQQQATDAARQMAAAQELGTIGQQTGALTQAGQQNLGTIGAQTAATAQAEAARQAAAQQQVADLAKMQQGLTTADAAALESVGTAQQQQAQRGLDVAYQDYQNQINYPQTQINNMSTTLRGLPPTAVPTTGTQTGYTTTFAPSPLSGIAAAYATYKGLTAAKGGLIQGYADGGAVTGSEDLYGSVMADYGKYLGNTNYYDSIMSQAQPAIEQNRNAMTDMAAYHAAHAPIASPNTVPALYKQYNTLKSSLNPGAVNEASAAANAMQAKYNEGLTALNPSAVTAAADAANAKLKEITDKAAILTAYNAGEYNVALPWSGTPMSEINRLIAEGYVTVAGSPKTGWAMKPKDVSVVSGMPPPSKKAAYDALLNNYNTLNSGYTTGLEKIAPLKTEYEKLLAKYNDLNSAYTADSAKLTGQKTAYEKALKASQIPSPFGNAMPHLAHGGRVPGYAEEGLVDTANPADLVDGGQAFADQYAQGQQEYPTQQDVPIQAPSLSSYTQDPEVLTANAERKALLKQLQQSLINTPASTDYGPSESEKWFKLAAAYADPGKTGSFLEGTGHAASAMAEHKAELRKAKAINAAADLQRLQARSELAQKQYEMTMDEGKRRMIEKYLTPTPRSTDGATVGGYNTGIPDNMKALLLSQDPADAVKTLVDMAKEQNKPSDLIRGVKFLVGNGSISPAQGDAIVQENLQGKLEMVDVPIPELGGTFKLTGQEARKFYDTNTLPARLAPTQAAAPSGAPAQVVPKQAPLSQEQIEAKKTGMIEQSKKDIEASDTLLSQKSFAKQQKDAANLIFGYAKTSPNSFGVIADPTFKNAVANLVETGVNTPWGSVGLAVEEPIAKLKLTGPEATVRQMAAAPIALIEVGYRKMYLKGEGAVSNMEGALTKYIGPQLSDNAKTVQLKAGMITIGAEKQEKIIDTFERYKEQHPEAGPRSFYQTPEYKRIVDNYENKYRVFAEKNGIPIGESSTKKSSGSLADRIREERKNSQNNEGR